MHHFFQTRMLPFVLNLVLAVSFIGCVPWGGMPGAFSRADTQSPAVQAAARFAVKAINEGPLLGSQVRDATPPNLELVKVLRACSQVVSGMNYSLTLEVRIGGVRRKVAASVRLRADANYQLEAYQILGTRHAWRRVSVDHHQELRRSGVSHG